MDLRMNVALVKGRVSGGVSDNVRERVMISGRASDELVTKVRYNMGEIIGYIVCE
jgi:hypothetical protein